MPSRSRSASSDPSPKDDPTPSPDPEPVSVPVPDSPTSPLFRESTPPQEPRDQGMSSPLHPSSGSLDASPNPDAGSGSASAPRSTGKARLRELRDMARAAVQTAGGMAHRFLTREGTPERDVELFVPDDDDVKAISEPLASLASRRAPEGAANPDAVDLVRLALGLVAYAAKQLEKKAWATSVRLAHLPDEPDEPATAGPEPAGTS